MPNPNGAVAGNDQNQPVAQTPRTRSTFPLHYHLFNTHRFGEYIPHYWDDLTKDDRYPVRSSGTLRSYTLKSPLMQNVKRNKDYFLVPYEAILPLNWEKFFDNPVRGDDVLDDVGPTVENFWNKVSVFVGSLRDACATLVNGITSSSSRTDMQTALQAVLRFLIVGEYFYSNGNLLSTLNCHGSPYCDVHYVYDPSNLQPIPHLCYDDYFDLIIGLLSDVFNSSGNLGVTSWATMQVDGFMYTISGDDDDPNFTTRLSSITLRHALQLMRDNPTFTITNIDQNNNSLSVFVAFFTAIKKFFPTQANLVNHYYLDLAPANVHCNLAPLWAYQLAVAHYFTNDHIDFVYSAELYRQLIGNYILSQTATFWSSRMNFTRNGITYRYDYLSAHFCAAFFDYIASNSSAPNNVLTYTTVSGHSLILAYLSALFGYRRSLRYLDYFTGSRAQPLAVVNTNQINTNVAVNSNQVSVIDITKSIQAQRFLNSVNRVRHNFEDYLKGIFGGKLPAPDYHNPFYMAHTDDVVFGQETENTATEQMTDNIAITTNLRSNSGNYMFEIDTDRPCVIIGITHYDITRIYTRSMARQFLHLNRFDWFNPFMQYIGDQPVYLQELGIWPGSSALNTLSNFAYQLRHSEFKQKYNYAAGGFAVPSTNLDNWIFPAVDRRGTQASINPDWIRSLNAEFDRFFVSLSGWSLGTYFHFIVDDFNSVNANRPMAYSPQILG